MPNWDISCLLALESWYKCKIIHSAVFSENIAMGKSISKILWNGVNWGKRARTKCDESFAVLYLKLFWHFWEHLWLFSMFWIRTPSQTSKKWRNKFSFYSFGRERLCITKLWQRLIQKFGQSSDFGLVRLGRERLSISKPCQNLF